MYGDKTLLKHGLAFEYEKSKNMSKDEKLSRYARLIESAEERNQMLAMANWRLREQVRAHGGDCLLYSGGKYKIHLCSVTSDMFWVEGLTSLKGFYGKVRDFLQEKGVFVDEIEALHFEDNEDGVTLRMKFSKKDADDGSDDKRHNPG